MDKPIRDLTITFAVMYNFSDVSRFKSRLTCFYEHVSTFYGVHKIYSIRKCQLQFREN